jgi:type IV secretory pathway TrbL component
VLATSGVDWSQVHAVPLLGLVLGLLIMWWAIRRMFGGRK